MRAENRERILSLLGSFGLTKLEAQVYLHLLVRGEAEAKEIVQTFNIYFPQFYGIVNSLERKGFIEVQQGRPKRYRAIDPRGIAETRIKEMENGVAVLTASVEEAREKTELLRRPSVWITRGIQNIMYNVREIIKNARFEVTMVVENAFVPDVAGALIKRSGEGVQTYLVTYPKPPVLDLVKKLRKIRRARVFETCPLAILVVADCERALMAHGLLQAAPPERQYGVIFDEPVNPIFLGENFYELWKRARPLFPEEDLDLPKSFRSQRMALVEINNLLKRGRVSVKVKGRYIKTSEPFEKKGAVVGITDNELHKNFSLRLPNGKIMSIGGFYSMLEETEAELITILKVESRK